ncbi:MAG: glycosyltransferase family 39 protein, partial [Chloroflexota bacterium]
AIALASAAAWIGLGASLDGGVSPAGVAARLKSLQRWEWVLGGSLIAAGLVARLWSLDSLPAGFWFDEATAGLEARSILSDPTFRPVYSGPTQSAAAYAYLVAGAEWALGQTITAVRLIPALAGALTPLFAWVVARHLLGPIAGVAGCGFMAFARWDINFSRIGMQNATTPLLLLVAFTLLLYALDTRRWALFAAFGVAMGGLGWFYTANFAFPLVLILAIPLMGRARGLRFGELGTRTTFTVFCALFVVTPLATYALGNFDAVSAHAKSLSLLQTVPPDQAPLTLADSGIKHLAMFTFAGDQNGRHNLPGAPMLDPVTGALFLLGGVAALRYWRDPRSVMFLSWTMIMLLPGVLSAPYESPQSLRSIGALPGAVILAVSGGWWMWQVLANGRVTTLSLAGLTTVLVTAAFLNLAFYFGPQAKDDAVWRSFSMGQTIMAKELAQSGAASVILASDHFVHHPVVRFLSGVEPAQLKSSDLPVYGGGLPVTIYLDPLDRGYYELI